MKNVTGPCDFKVGPGRRFRSGELKSGELLTIGIGMILTVDRKHLFLCSSIILVSNGTSIFLREKVSETKDFIEKANGGKEP